jgi:hypothetical protein
MAKGFGCKGLSGIGLSGNGLSGHRAGAAVHDEHDRTYSHTKTTKLNPQKLALRADGPASVGSA